MQLPNPTLTALVVLLVAADANAQPSGGTTGGQGTPSNLRVKLEQLQPGPAVVDGGRVAEGLPDYFPAPGRVRHGTLAYFALRSVFAELDGRRSPAIEHLDAALSAAGRQSPQQRAWLLALTRFWLAQALPEPTRSRLEEVVEDQLDDVLSMVTLARTLERSAPRLRRRLLARAKREAETPDEKLLLATDVKERIMLEFHAARSRDPASLGRVYLSAQLLGNEELMESSLKKLREIEWTSDLASAAETLEWGGAGTASAELLRRAVERAKVPDSLYPVIRFTANRALTELAETAFAQGLTLCEDVDAALGLLELAEEAGLDLNRALAAAVRLVDAADRVEELGQVARRLRDGSLRELLKQDQLDLASAVSAIGGERSSEVKARRPPPGFLRYFGLQVDTDFTFHRDAVDYAFASGATARSLDYSGAFLGVKLEIPVLGVRYAVDIIDESPSVSQTDGGGGRSTILELDSVNLIRLKPLIDGEDIWVRHHDSAGKKGLWMLLAGNRYGSGSFRVTT